MSDRPSWCTQVHPGQEECVILSGSPGEVCEQLGKGSSTNLDGGAIARKRRNRFRAGDIHRFNHKDSLLK